jgi:hypothetical protein
MASSHGTVGRAPCFFMVLCRLLQETDAHTQLHKDRQTLSHTHILTDREGERPSHTHTHTQIEQTYNNTIKQTDRQADELAERQLGRMLDRQTHKQTD